MPESAIPKQFLLMFVDLVERVTRTEIALAGLAERGTISLDHLNHIQVDVAEVYSEFRGSIEGIDDDMPLAEFLELLNQGNIVRRLYHYTNPPSSEE